MSIVILVGGRSAEGNYEHRYLVQQFLERFPDQVLRVITTTPTQRTLSQKISRTIKRGGYAERIRRAIYNRTQAASPELLGDQLFGTDKPATMPGGNKVQEVSGHNAADCEALLRELQPDVIVVYGTMLIKENIFSQAKICTLNMHTGLSPYYRGDSTLFWPVYYNDKDHLGVTVHQLVPEVDGGDIVYTGRVHYETGDREAHIFAKGVKTGSELYLQAVEDALNGTIEYHQQDLAMGREFRWIHRTVAAEKQVTRVFDEWEQAALNNADNPASSQNVSASAPGGVLNGGAHS